MNRTDRAGEPTDMALDIILDTDIGTDVDDAYALLFALASPELNLRGITLVHHDVQARWLITAKMLQLAGRTDIPVALGENLPMNRERRTYWDGYEGKGIDYSDTGGISPVGEHASEYIARMAAENPGKITLCPIGPLTNVGILLRDFPNEAAKLKGLVVMGSTFEGYGPEHAAREHNAGSDPEAMKLLCESGLPILIVGFNVTRQTSLTDEHLARIASAGTPMSELMVHMTRGWLRVCNRAQTSMHDPLALAAAFRPEIVGTVPVSAEVSLGSPEVVTYRHDPDSNIRICDTVDVPRFEELFLERIYGAVGA